ncbi:hypothetical protein KBW71_07730 [Hydrogenophaga aromaticivorans]|uniref:hypothetical protein n=1 Tax=Hydrogenophaga aromaticivorans TaxID=2610898 RepID=UPI001B36BF98|nr:hypothetical protein [Hydrogenophaga aromaticivorans]MBQ0918332.1 hypothetical protein [Hydrogenophaga aromaticivorans]
MTNVQSFASDRAQMEAQIAVAHALKMRRSAVRRAKVQGLWRNLKSLVARNRVTTGLAVLLIMMTAALFGMAWRVQEAQIRSPAPAPAPAGAPKPSPAPAPVVRLVPEAKPIPAAPAVDLQVTVGTAETESDGASPVLRMDYQLSQPTPKGSTP